MWWNWRLIKVKGKNIFFTFYCLLFISCSGSFTPEERRIINEGEGIMRVLKIDNPSDSLFLRKVARPLWGDDLDCEVFQKLKERMLATVNDPADPGVGIAAPQVGISRELIAVQRFDKSGEPFEFYIDPKIESYSEEKVFGLEGCLSVPEVMDSVWRSKEVTISYIPEPGVKADSGYNIHFGVHYKKDMRRRTEQIKGFTAVIFQHEIDHLRGILFIDHLDIKERKLR